MILRRLPIGRARGRQLIRYGLVGITLVVTDYAIYLAIIAVVPHAVLPAYVASRLIAGIVGFVGHARFSFGNVPLSFAGGARYALVTAANMLLSSILLAAILPIAGPIAGKMIIDCVGVATGYFAGRHLIFAPRGEHVVPR